MTKKLRGVQEFRKGEGEVPHPPYPCRLQDVRGYKHTSTLVERRIAPPPKLVDQRDPGGPRSLRDRTPVTA